MLDAISVFSCSCFLCLIFPASFVSTQPHFVAPSRSCVLLLHSVSFSFCIASDSPSHLFLFEFFFRFLCLVKARSGPTIADRWDKRCGTSGSKVKTARVTAPTVGVAYQHTATRRPASQRRPPLPVTTWTTSTKSGKNLGVTEN